MGDLIVRILEQNNSNMGAAKTLVKGKTELEKMLVNILVQMKNVKGAVKIVKEFQMEPNEFPLLVETASFNASNYFVS